MSYPSIYITTSSLNPNLPESTFQIQVNGNSIAIDKGIRNKIVLLEDDSYLFFSHTNEEFKKVILQNKGTIGNISTYLLSNFNKFHWGFYCLINKLNSEILLYNDVFGIYPIYWQQENNSFIISNNFDLILKNTRNPEFDQLGLYDYFLFNYTLNDRTLIKGVSQLQGGRCLNHGGSKKITTSEFYDVFAFIHDNCDKKIDFNKAVRRLTINLLNDIDPELPVQLPLSGGFDSKVLLSILLANGKPFSAYTYGAKNSVDHIAAEQTTKTFTIPYNFLEIKEKTIPELDENIRSFINSSPGLPLILDLISYEQVKQNLPPSNITIGAMGGELINGPVIVSQVIITKPALTVTTAKNIVELQIGLKSEILSIPFLNYEIYGNLEQQYSLGLSNYIANPTDKYVRNITRFMLNETYSKFFGVVFRVLFGRNNLIFPFADPEFLKLLLNSQYRYSKHKPFSKNPLSHLLSRRLYPKLIQKIYKPVIYTPLDRKYVMADLLYIHRLPITLKRYIENHLFKNNKTETSKTLNYTKWLQPLIIEKLQKSPVLEMQIIQKEKVIEILENLKKNIPVSDFKIRKLILLLSIHYFYEKYHLKLN